MKQEHIHFDGLLKPEILDKLKILKGGTFSGLYAEGAIITFARNLKSRFGENLQEIILHEKSVFQIGYQQGSKKTCKYLSLYPHWEDNHGDCNTFYVDLLDELPQSLFHNPKRVVFDWHNDSTQVRTIESIQFYGTNRYLVYTNGNTELICRQETIEFMVFNFTNQPKIFFVHDSGGRAEIIFDLDISIAEFIDKQGYEKSYGGSEKWNIVLQHEI